MVWVSPLRNWMALPTRLARSVIHVRSLHGTAIHPTQKPVELIDLLIRYACPPDGIVVDPFAGSGSTDIAARAAGRAGDPHRGRRRAMPAGRPLARRHPRTAMNARNPFHTTCPHGRTRPVTGGRHGEPTCQTE
jgi:DNA methylase